jgi:hypothetical protein
MPAGEPPAVAFAAAPGGVNRTVARDQQHDVEPF